MLLAGALATLLVIVLGPFFIAWSRRNEFGQNIREDGPGSHHLTKVGTPTMGGLLIFFSMSVPYFLIGRAHTNAGLVVWLTMMMCALIGFWDDWMKIANKRSLGLSGKKKMVALLAVTAFLGYTSHVLLNISTVVQIPFSNMSVDLHWGWYVLLFFVIAGASNGVNLTDGLDGLAASTAVLSLMAFVGISFILWDRQLADIPPLTIGTKGALDVSILASALAGACVGFMWHNAFPAKVFMGDTGSMGLGGALAALSVVTKNELLFVIIGGIFVVESISVITQVLVFKRTGKRVFLMAPIHHHFELKDWSETQIMVRFCIVAGLFAATGFTVWFRTH